MRINLHQHTIAVKTGETNNRNLDISNQHNVDLFVSNLERWEVGILAITNHNLFDLEQFNFLEDIVQSKGILLLPGIEIDIEDSEGKIHNMNIIVSNEDKKIWDEFVLSLNITDPNNFSIPVYALTQKLSKFNKICLIPNNQKGGKELPKDDYNLFSDENSIYFFETTNLDSSRILAHKGIPAICGSDEKDILNPQYNKIPDIHIKIDSFTSLINFFKKDLNFMKNKLSEKLFGTISIHPSTWQDAIKVPLYYDTNIIIGSRGSGKSIILEEIKKEVERVKNIKIDLYDHKDDNYNRLLKELESQFLNPIDLNSEIQNLNILLKNSNLPKLDEVVTNYINMVSFCNTNKVSKYIFWQEFNVQGIDTQMLYKNPEQCINEMKKLYTDKCNLEESLNILDKNKINLNDTNYVIGMARVFWTNFM